MRLTKADENIIISVFILPKVPLKVDTLVKILTEIFAAILIQNSINEVERYENSSLDKLVKYFYRLILK